MTGRTLIAAATLAVLLPVAPKAQQEIGELDLLLERLGQYLIAYESQLTTVVADERYQQSQLRPMGRSRSMVSESRRLDSDIAFLRLPGEAIWYGVRDVKRVDGVQVDEGVKTP